MEEFTLSPGVANSNRSSAGCRPTAGCLSLSRDMLLSPCRDYTRDDGGDSTSEVSVSCSSTDETSSSLEGNQGPGVQLEPRGEHHVWGSREEAERLREEAKDRVTEVPLRSSILRNSIRSLSPLRRHSWGPGKEQRRRRRDEPQEIEHGLYVTSVLVLSPQLQPGGSQRDPGGPEGPGHSSEAPPSAGALEERRLPGITGKSRRYRPLRNSCPPMALPLTKSVSMLAISQRDLDAVGHLRRKRRISFSFNFPPLIKSKSQFLYGESSSSDDEDNLSMRSFSSASGSLAYSISEEEPGPLRSDADGKSTTKVSRTFSYLKNKMYKKTREKEKKSRHVGQCLQCSKAFNSKEAFLCSHCNASVHKSCRDSLPVCAKVKMKQFSVPDSAPFPTVTMRNKRPLLLLSLGLSSRRHTSIIGFHGNNLSKSLSISNIAGPVFDDIPIRGLRYLSQSTDSLNRTNQVTESMESLTDEGTEMMDGQLMGEFEAEAREMEADSWSLGAEQEYLQQLDKELVKKQDVIYELMQTELHHIRTLRILSEVYRHGLQKELTLELQTVERLFPVLDELLELHTQHLLRLLERKRESQLQGHGGGRAIHRIGDLLLGQFSGSNGESMKRVYGRFCSRHNEAVNLYKELLTKDKRFKACIKKKMSSSIVRRLGIPECILLVTQRITKYPVLIQRMLQHTRESEEDHEDLSLAVRLVKEVIAAVDSKRGPSEAEAGARRGLQLKNVQGRLKDVHALLLSDVFVFLQEKDQKYIFSMLVPPSLSSPSPPSSLH
ncbi:hypothetical protein KUCAC02_013278 [Chaenocephalus aceratus]|nr:hypothetical protein KUCAC02_013278 [Chaenocephalus aceratus]